MKTFTRSKKLFKSARSAWADIGRATGLEPSDVGAGKHTRTKWIWMEKGKRRNNPHKSMAKARKPRKKARSAKQKAATRKLVARNRRKGRSKPKTTRKKRKVNKRKTTHRSMAKGGKKSFIDKIPLLKNRTVQKIGFGLGMGVIAIGIIDTAAKFVPALAAPLVQNKRIIKLGVELATEPLSAVADVVLTGGLGSLGSLTGSQQQVNGVQTVGNGFA